MNKGPLDKNLLDNFRKSKFYKLDFGLKEFKKKDDIQFLIFLATLSGFSGIDIIAKSEYIKLACDEIHKATKKSNELQINCNPQILLFASFGINKLSNLKESSFYKELDMFRNTPFHVLDIHFNEITFLDNFEKVDMICEIFKDKIISVNLSRSILSNAHMIDLLEKCFKNMKKNLIIEVEGMRFYDDKFNHNLQTISTADIINKQFKQKSFKYKNVPIILGNCHDLEIENLSRECNVSFNGISINYQSIKSLFKQKSYLYSNENIIFSVNKIKSKYINLQ